MFKMSFIFWHTLYFQTSPTKKTAQEYRHIEDNEDNPCHLVIQRIIIILVVIHSASIAVCGIDVDIRGTIIRMIPRQ